MQPETNTRNRLSTCPDKYVPATQFAAKDAKHKGDRRHLAVDDPEYRSEKKPRVLENSQICTGRSAANRKSGASPEGGLSLEPVGARRILSHTPKVKYK